MQQKYEGDQETEETLEDLVRRVVQQNDEIIEHFEAGFEVASPESFWSSVFSVWGFFIVISICITVVAIIR